MFNNSHDFTLNAPIFSNAGRDVTLNIFEEKSEQGLLTLYRHISTSASYNAGARYPPPLCHPGTREAILSDLKNWASAPARLDDSRIRWLYGPAGAGKSAIAQTFAQECAKNGTLLGSFFFWRSDSTRNNPERLFNTLALQMAIAIPELRPIVNATVAHDPFIPTSSIEFQCDVLVAQPWLKARLHQELRGRYHIRPTLSTGSSPQGLTISGDAQVSNVHPKLSSTVGHAQILIIDGLNECSDSHNQQRILSLLADIVQKYSLPVQILVCSRPEPRIKESIAELEFKSICQRMPLYDTYEASRDIRLYLKDGFENILAHHSDSMQHIPRPWPRSDQIEYLVQKASGQFIYPSTVLKYLNGDGDVPADRLNVILGLQEEDHGSRDSPYAALDALYLWILETVKKPALLIQVLAARIAFVDDSEYQVHFVNLLGIPVGTLHATFSSVHALFQDPSPIQSGFEFCHASFTDFLLDPNRSHHFHIDISSGHDFLAQRCLELYSDSSSFGSYAQRNWIHYCAYARGSNDLISKLDSFPVYKGILQAVALCPTDQRLGWVSELARCLSLILLLWHKVQGRCGQCLKHIKHISTVGFLLAVECPTLSQKKQYLIPIQCPPSLSSAIVEGTFDDVFQGIEVHLQLFIENVISPVVEKSSQPQLPYLYSQQFLPLLVFPLQGFGPQLSPEWHGCPVVLCNIRPLSVVRRWQRSVSVFVEKHLRRK